MKKLLNQRSLLILLTLVLCSSTFHADLDDNFIEQYSNNRIGVSKEMWVNLPSVQKPQKVWVEVIDNKLVFEGDIVLNNDAAVNWINQLKVGGIWNNWIDNVPSVNDIPIIGEVFSGKDDVERNSLLPSTVNLSFSFDRILSDFKDLSDVSELSFPSDINNFIDYDLGPDDLINPAVATNYKSQRWSDGIIPFEIKRGFPRHKIEQINAAIQELNSKTNLTLVKRTNQSDYVSFFYGSGCWSMVGKVGGKQEISIGENCSKGSIIHEICHAAGLYHEQSRSDRDEFVKIYWNNINPNRRNNFEKHVTGAEDIGSYNFESIMHYSAYAFSTNNKPTIVSKTGASFGQRVGLSYGDITALNKLYPKGSSGGGNKPSNPVPSTDKEIYAGTNRWDGKAYFFKNNNYTRYNTYTWRKDYGYPKNTQIQWKGIDWSAPDAALSWGNGKVYLFKNKEYVRFDMSRGSMDPGYPKSITGNWPIYWNYLDATVSRGDGEKIYFFKGDEYVRVDLRAGLIDYGYPKKIKDGWSGLEWNDIDAAVNWNGSKIYFFKGNQYVRYDMRRGKVDRGYPRKISEYWPEI